MIEAFQNKHNTRKVYVLLINALLFSSVSYAHIVEYKLNVSKQKVNFSGKEADALVLNHAIPGPTLKATVGDTFRVAVTNSLDVETSIHWHGVLVPNNMDGVPYVNGPPIMPGETFLYEFPIKHSGTYWYHAHSALQEQQGVYGSLVFYPQHEVKDFDEEHVIVLSDWTDENPDRVLAHLKKNPDYYALKKDSVQSWFKILQNGYHAVKMRINNASMRMGPMDLSDIGYDAFLLNGKKSSVLSHAKPGTCIKLRIINAAASSYFILEYSGGAMKVIESDGVKIEPFTAQRIRMAMAETYDVIVTIPQKRTYELRASAEDGTGYAITHMGEGVLIPAPLYPKPNLVLMDMMGMHHSGMGGHDMSNMTMPMTEPHVMNRNNMHPGAGHSSGKSLPHVDYLSDYKPVKSLTLTTLPKNQLARVVKLRLTGSMERYVWTINDIPMYASDEIVVKKGENVRFVLVNETMMNHPIHLHGHFFRVLNGQGDYSPLKHTVNVSPFETVEIEFDANQEKDWIFHCHNLYHMKLGMGGIIHYEGTTHDASLKHHASSHSSEHGNIWFNATEIQGYSNLSKVTSRFMRNNDYFIADFRHNYIRDYEGELIYQRYVSQFLGLYIGGKLSRERDERKNHFMIGMEYTLPLFIKADLRLNTDGTVRFGVSNEHQLSDRVSFDWNWNTDKEYLLRINYAFTPQIEISGNYDSREQWGIGLNLKL